MNNNTIKTIIGVVILVILLGIALSILKFAIKVLLPLAIVVIAAYIVYSFIRGRR